MSGATLKRTLVALPGVGVSLLPKLMCPACWPAYAGIGLGPGVGLPRLRKISSLANRRLPQHHPRKPRVPSFSTARLWPSLDGDLCLGNHPGWQVLLRASAVDVRRSRTAHSCFSLEQLAATCG